MEYTLNDLDSLQRLRNEQALKNSIRKIKVNTDDALLSQTLEEKLNKYYFACGCEAGAITVLVTLFSYFLGWWSSGFTLSIGWWRMAGILLVAALAGKLVGLLINRYRLEKLFRVLETLYT